MKLTNQSFFTCQKYQMFEDGTQFDATKLRDKDGLFLTANDMCKSHHVMVIDEVEFIYECRKAPHGVDVKYESDLRRKDGTTEFDCKYKNYHFKNKDKPVNHADHSKCGFNNDNYSY